MKFRLRLWDDCATVPVIQQAQDIDKHRLLWFLTAHDKQTQEAAHKVCASYSSVMRQYLSYMQPFWMLSCELVREFYIRQLHASDGFLPEFPMAWAYRSVEIDDSGRARISIKPDSHFTISEYMRQVIDRVLPQLPSAHQLKYTSLGDERSSLMLATTRPCSSPDSLLRLQSSLQLFNKVHGS
ncbi:MAG: hypothetical protein M3Z49_01675 [Bifidobacteriales bacterium]|uniref:hypothetical protein n=1 Tax=Bifidobacterium asteroides TaxID=1684 RepID=UPI003A806ADD|nr:hypothetical protein [Bifidobacteriales bacterium]